MDNVYAESVPQVPLSEKVQKPKADAFIQAADNAIRRIGGDMPGMNEEDDDDDYLKKRNKKLRRRGRKNEYY